MALLKDSHLVDCLNEAEGADTPRLGKRKVREQNLGGRSVGAVAVGA